ncbi:MAG: uroporphyrinogen decarboxylase family protein [Gemmatimonadota bacterium]
MTGLADLDGREMERRRDRFRRAWRYEPVDHMPIAAWLDDPGPYSLRQLCEDGQLQFERQWHNNDRLLRLLSDDYLPAARVWPGYVTIATVFGVPLHWGEDPNQPPGVLEHPIRDLDQVAGLALPDAATRGLMPLNCRWLAYFAAHFPPEVSLAGIDLGGPLNTALDLLGADLLYTSFCDAPEALHRLLDLATRVQIDCLRVILEAAGGLDRMTGVDFDSVWAPEGHKGFVSDDVCATLSPATFRDFSAPYNSRILRLWPGGRLHNCGPHPALDHYLDHDPPLDGLNCSYRHTRGDLARIRAAFRGRGLVELMFDNGETGDEILRGYAEIVAALAPDVVGIPLLCFDARWSDGDIREVYEGVRRIAERYAREMNWVGAGARGPETGR